MSRQAPQIHNHRELEHAVRRAGCTIEYGGRHPCIKTPGGARVPFPAHPGDMRPGTLRSILKMLEAAGVILGTLLAIAVSWGWLPIG